LSDGYWTGFVEGVVSETGPWIVFWSFDQVAVYWVAVDIAKLFDALCPREDIEVVVAWEPEGSLWQFPRDGSLNDSEGDAKGLERWLGDKKVNVFRHYDVAEDMKVVSFADGLQSV
jgi:hypothetical protein